MPAWPTASKEERIDALRRIQAAVAANREELLEATFLEYGAPLPFSAMIGDTAINSFGGTAKTLEDFDFAR